MSIRPEYEAMGLGPWYAGLIAAVESFKQTVKILDGQLARYEQLKQERKITTAEDDKFAAEDVYYYDDEENDEQSMKRLQNMRSALMDTVRKYEYYIDRHSTTRQTLPNVFYT